MTFCRMRHVVPSPSLPVIPGQALMIITFVARLLYEQSLMSVTLTRRS
jgi:hypothetical protein